MKPSIRSTQLDGLRGTASLMVFFNHLALTILPSLTTLSPDTSEKHFFVALGFSPLSVFWGGDFGVCIFFILSGYVLSQFCSHSQLGLFAMMVRRYIRLALPMLFSTIFAFTLLSLGLFVNNLAAKIVTHSDWLAMWYQMQANGWLAVKEGLISAFVDGKSTYNCNLWTMRFELIGSILLFMIYAFLRQRSARILCLILAIVSLPSYFPLFPAGALLFELSQNNDVIGLRYPRTISLTAVILFVLGIYAGSFPASGEQISFPSPWHHWFIESRNAQAWHMWGSVFVMLGITYSQTIGACFKSAMCQFLGKISFSLYLIQIAVLCSFTSYMMLYLKNLNYLFAVCITGTSSLFVTFILSYIAYVYIDLPTLSLSREMGKLVKLWLPTYQMLRSKQ